MSWWRRLLGQKATQLTYDQIASLIDGTDAGRSIAGLLVTDKTALQVATVLACVRAIADGCATPRLEVFRELDNGKRERATNIPEYRLLNRRPNEWQTSYEWRRLMTAHAALTGAALSIKVRGANRRVRELIPVLPGRWDVRRISRYEVRYRVWDEFGFVGEFMPDDVFVLHGMQWDYIGAINHVRAAASAIALGMAAERSQAAFHENGARPSGTYSVDGTLTSEQHDKLTAWLRRQYAGSERAGLPMVLDRAAKWIQTSMTGVDAQHLETRRMQVEEVCRAFNVFPIMVGHNDKAATFASSEAFFAAHVKHTLAPWHMAWTQRLDETLLDGSGPLFAEFDTRYLMAGDMTARSQWARTMAEMGIYTRNELRDEEGKDPLEGLDEPLTPMNMGGAGATPNPPPDDGAAAAKAGAVREALGQLDTRLAALQAGIAAKPVQISLNTDAIQREFGAAMQSMAKAHAEHMRSVASEMPITINVPQQPAPVVNVTVPTPDVVVEATMPAPVVIQSHPVESLSTIVREDGEISGQRTTFKFQP
jgi:HK97 family phage portal protein